MENNEPFIFTMVLRHFWLVFIVVSCINVIILKHHSKKHIKKNPELAEGYEKLIKGTLFWINIPWIVMGIGCTIGNVPSAFNYFFPRDGNPYVTAWFGTVIGLWILSTKWLFLNNGAEFLSKHPGLIVANIGMKRTEITNPKAIKILWLVCLAGGILGFIFMWNNSVF